MRELAIRSSEAAREVLRSEIEGARSWVAGGRSGSRIADTEATSCLNCVDRADAIGLMLV